MSTNAIKTPSARSLNQFAERKVLDAIQQLGRALPCQVVANDNSIVTVKFLLDSPFTLPQVTMPMFGPEYIRYPIQPGDQGFTIPADVYLGGVSGLGGGTAGLARPANLAALVFLPISQKKWATVDPDAVTVYGPNGVALRNTSNTSSLILLPGGIAMIGQDHVNITVGGVDILVSATGVHIDGNVSIHGSLTVDGGMAVSGGVGATASFTGSIEATGEITAGTIPLSSHVHTGVQTGGSNTGGPTP